MAVGSSHLKCRNQRRLPRRAGLSLLEWAQTGGEITPSLCPLRVRELELGRAWLSKWQESWGPGRGCSRPWAFSRGSRTRSVWKSSGLHVSSELKSDICSAGVPSGRWATGDIQGGREGSSEEWKPIHSSKWSQLDTAGSLGWRGLSSPRTPRRGSTRSLGPRTAHPLCLAHGSLAAVHLLTAPTWP